MKQLKPTIHEFSSQYFGIFQPVYCTQNQFIPKRLFFYKYIVLHLLYEDLKINQKIPQTAKQTLLSCVFVRNYFHSWINTHLVLLY